MGGTLSLVPSLSVKILCWVAVIDILLNAILFIILYCLFRQKKEIRRHHLGLCELSVGIFAVC